MAHVHDVLNTPNSRVHDVLNTLRVHDVLNTDTYWLRMLVLSGLRTRNRGQLFLNFAQTLILREIEEKPRYRDRQPAWTTIVDP